MMMYVYVSVYVLLPGVCEFGIFACWYAMIIFVNLTKLSGLIWDWFASYDCRASKWSRQNCERNVRSNSILFLRITFSHKKPEFDPNFMFLGVTNIFTDPERISSKTIQIGIECALSKVKYQNGCWSFDRIGFIAAEIELKYIAGVSLTLRIWGSVKTKFDEVTDL